MFTGASVPVAPAATPFHSPEVQQLTEALEPSNGAVPALPAAEVKLPKRAKRVKASIVLAVQESGDQSRDAENLQQAISGKAEVAAEQAMSCAAVHSNGIPAASKLRDADSKTGKARKAVAKADTAGNSSTTSKQNASAVEVASMSPSRVAPAPPGLAPVGPGQKDPAELAGGDPCLHLLEALAAPVACQTTMPVSATFPAASASAEATDALLNSSIGVGLNSQQLASAKAGLSQSSPEPNHMQAIDGHPKAVSAAPTASNKQQAPNKPILAVASEAEHSVSSVEQRAEGAGHEATAMGQQAPAASQQAEAASQQAPAASRHATAASQQATAASQQAPAASQQAAAATQQASAASKEATAASQPATAMPQHQSTPATAAMVIHGVAHASQLTPSTAQVSCTTSMTDLGVSQERFS